MVNKMELLPLQPEYCRAVFEIAKESLPEHWSFDGVKDVLRYDNNIYYVAKISESDEIAGFAGVMLVADEAELLNIAVKKEYRTKGIGQSLLNKVMEESGKNGAARMLLEVRKSNGKAIDLYKKNHFSVLGERKAYYSNPTEDAVIMERHMGIL